MGARHGQDLRKYVPWGGAGDRGRRVRAAFRSGLGKATLFIPIKSLRKLPEIINQARDQAALMGECALTQWRAFFAPGVIAGDYANAILDLVHSECFNSDRDSEVRRINGMALRWKNGWTLPQRIVSGIRRKAFPKTNREHPFS